MMQFVDVKVGMGKNDPEIGQNTEKVDKSQEKKENYFKMITAS